MVLCLVSARLVARFIDTVHRLVVFIFSVAVTICMYTWDTMEFKGTFEVVRNVSNDIRMDIRFTVNVRINYKPMFLHPCTHICIYIYIYISMNCYKRLLNAP